MKYDHQDRDDPFNVVETVTLDPSEKATVTFTPDNRVSDYFLPVVAVSKYDQSTYRVSTDSTAEFGEASLPPTDPDDTADTFRPPETFSESCTVEITNLSGVTRAYNIQLIGWERRRRIDEGGL